MPAMLRKWLLPDVKRILQIGGFAALAVTGVALVLALLHRGLLPIVGYLFPQFEPQLYDWIVFGKYRTHDYVSFDLDAPQGVINRWDDKCQDGYVFIAPAGSSVRTPGPVMLDAKGELVWMENKFAVGTNFQIQEYKGENYLTFWGGHKKGSTGIGQTYILDSTYQVAHEIHAVGEGLKADLHEFEITQDDTALITIYNRTQADLRKMGWWRKEDGWIEDGIFQEIDIATGELLFQWRARDYYKPEESYYWNPLGGYVYENPFDFFHINSLKKDSKGNYLIGSRHFHTVTYVNGTSGDIIWILGGQRNDFLDLTDGRATTFQWQHDARWFSEEDQILSLMDNGAAGLLHIDAPYAKGLLIQLDQENMTATHLQSYTSMGRVKSASQGNVQLLHNDHIFTGWGSAAAYSEYEMDGTLLCEHHFAPSWTFWQEYVKNYRAYKYPLSDWVGTPHYPPSAKIKDGSLYVSWNGATEVKFWQLEGARGYEDGTAEGEEAFVEAEIIEKTRFEESFVLPSDEGFVRYRAVALDKERQPMQYSDPVDWDDDQTWSNGLFMLGIFAAIALVVCGAWFWLKIRNRPGKLFQWEQAGQLFGYRYSKL